MPSPGRCTPDRPGTRAGRSFGALAAEEMRSPKVISKFINSKTSSSSKSYHQIGVRGAQNGGNLVQLLQVAGNDGELLHLHHFFSAVLFLFWFLFLVLFSVCLPELTCAAISDHVTGFPKRECLRLCGGGGDEFVDSAGDRFCLPQTLTDVNTTEFYFLIVLFGVFFCGGGEEVSQL